MTRMHLRPAFTIIEILTVVAILAILAALTAAGVGRVRMAQMQRNTEQTLTKLQLALDQQWKATADLASPAKLPPNMAGTPPTDFHAKNMWTLYNHFNTVTAYASSREEDKKLRAAAAYAYMLMRWEFPQTFQEAKSPVSFGGVVLPVRSTFNSCTPGAWSGENEAAALLYMILATKGTNGTAFNADEATQQAQGEVSVGGTSFRVFTDAWGTPITFRRFVDADATGGELNDKPYARSDMNKDPLDPKGLIGSNSGASSSGMEGTVFPAGVPGSAIAFNNKNRQPTVISAGPDSAGPDKNWGALYDGDNLVGYRLRRQGARGD